MMGFPDTFITVYIRGRPFLVSLNTTHRFLPLISREDLISPLYAFPPPDRYMVQALTYLFDHIHKVSIYGASAILLDRLERSYKQSGRRHRSPDGQYHPTVEVFIRLGEILTPNGGWGHHPELFDHMCTFFTKHCETLIRLDPYGVVECLIALDRMGERITAAVTCVVRSPYADEVINAVFEKCAADDEYVLSPRTMADLERMGAQAGGRQRRHHQEAMRFPGRRRGSLTYGGRGLRKSCFWRGDHLPVKRLMDMVVHSPENLIVSFGGHGEGRRRLGHRMPHSLESLYDCDGISDDDSDFEGFVRGRRHPQRLLHGPQREMGFIRGLEHGMPEACW